MKKLTKIERETVLRILSSAIDCFGSAEFDINLRAYSDNGNFICTLPSKEAINSLESAYTKILLS